MVGVIIECDCHFVYDVAPNEDPEKMVKAIKECPECYEYLTSECNCRIEAGR